MTLFYYPWCRVMLGIFSKVPLKHEFSMEISQKLAEIVYYQ